MPDTHPSAMIVNGLRVPHLMVTLLSEGRWRHPGDEVLSRVVPFLQDPVDFLDGPAEFARESKQRGAREGSLWCHALRRYSGSRTVQKRGLPWLDVDQAIFVAVCRHIGDDVAIVLDFRTDKVDPRVVATYWGQSGCEWRVVSASFSDFVTSIGLL